MALGLAFGNYFFAGLEAVFGEPYCDIIMALGGAIIGGLAHELVANAIAKPEGPR